MNSDSLSRQDFNLLPVAPQRIKYSLDGSTNTCMQEMRERNNAIVE